MCFVKRHGFNGLKRRLNHGNTDSDRLSIHRGDVPVRPVLGGQPMTNGDMIRQMSDEELAYLIWKDPGNLFYKGPMEALVWLSEEASDERRC